MKQLVRASRFEFAKEGEVVLKMIDDFQNQQQVERWGLDRTDIGERELQTVVLSFLAHLERVRRDVPTEEMAIGIHPELHLTEHFACATSDLPDGLWFEVVTIQHLQDLASLPLRAGDVPVGVVA